MPIINKLQEASKKQSTVRLSYSDSKGVVSVREVEPYEIKEDKLYAFCLGKQSIRAFKLSKIHSLEVTNNIFKPRFPVMIGANHE